MLNSHNEVIVSSLADDPDMAELLDMFKADLPAKVSNLLKHQAEGNVQELRRAAHQLKGSAGGYGFNCLTLAAGELEYSLSGSPTEEQISNQVRVIVEMIQSIR